MKSYWIGSAMENVALLAACVFLYWYTGSLWSFTLLLWWNSGYKYR